MIFHQLDKYMLNTNNMSAFFLKTPTPLKKKEKVIESIKIEKESYTVPRFEDSLFWCFYIIKYGLSKYTMIQHNFAEEQKIKINMVELIRDNKDILKKMKIKRTILENDLLYGKKMTVTTFVCLCRLNNLNIIVIDGNKYIESIYNENTLCSIIEKNENVYGIHSYDTVIQANKKITNCKKNCWKVDNFEKPLKSFSTYKAKELRKICGYLKIDIYNERNKIINMRNLYKLIVEQI